MFRLCRAVSSTYLSWLDKAFNIKWTRNDGDDGDGIHSNLWLECFTSQRTHFEVNTMETVYTWDYLSFQIIVIFRCLQNRTFLVHSHLTTCNATHYTLQCYGTLHVCNFICWIIIWKQKQLPFGVSHIKKSLESFVETVRPGGAQLSQKSAILLAIIIVQHTTE